jgi:hypothetical protein
MTDQDSGVVREATAALLRSFSTAASWPIYIRDAEGVPVTETTLTSILKKPPSLEMGQYVAAVELPTGKQISQRFEIADNGRLDLTPLVANARSSLETAGFAVADRLPSANHLLAAGTGFISSAAVAAGNPFLGVIGMGISSAASNVERITAFHGTTLGAEPKAVHTDVQQIPGSNALRVSAFDGNRPTTFNFNRADREEFTLVLLPGSTATVTVDDIVDVSTGDAFADQLLRFRSAGKIYGLNALTSATDSDAVRARLDHPAAAIAITYRMLRVGHPETDKAATVLEPLAHFADTLVIRAERLALQGEHLQALALFIQASETDLPAFSQGVTLLTDRLRRYAALGGEQCEPELLIAKLPPDAPTRAQAALPAIQGYSARCAFDVPFTRYSGPFTIQA